jgi:hypothetical protein
MPASEDRRASFVAWIAHEGTNASRVAQRSKTPYTTIADYVRGRTRSLKGSTEAQIAQAHGATTDFVFGWGFDRPGASPARQIPIVGYVGAASEFFGFDDHAQGAGLDIIEAPPGVPDGAVAVIVRGDSGYPAIRDGMVLIYWNTGADPDGLVGEDCFVKLRDGRTLVKILERGTQAGRWTLSSINASTPPIRDVEIEWAAPIEVRLRRMNWKSSV